MEQLPMEMLLEIGSYLSCRDFKSFSLVSVAISSIYGKNVFQCKCKTVLDAIKNEHLEYLDNKYSSQQEEKYFDSDDCFYAAISGNVDCLKYIHERSSSLWNINAGDDDETMQLVAEEGRLECLKYLHKHGCPWNKWTTYLSAQNGHFECLEYAVENGCPLHEDTANIASVFNHLECLNYAVKNGCLLE